MRSITRSRIHVDKENYDTYNPDDILFFKLIDIENVPLYIYPR